MLRLGEVFRFELAIRLRQPATAVYALLLVGLALLVVARGLNPAMTPQLNAPANVAELSLLLGLLGTLVTGALFVEAGHRDLRWGMAPLLHAAPLARWEYLGGRFLAELLLNAVLLLAVPLGLGLGTWLPAVSPAALGPSRLDAYLLPYLVFLLPNLLVTASLLFGITVLTRRSLPGYLAALGLIIGMMVSVNEAGSHAPALWALLDPTGEVAQNAITRGWTRVEQSTRLVELQGLLLWNRLLWTAIAVGILAFTCRRFRLTEPDAGGRRRARHPAPEPAPTTTAPRAGRPVAPVAHGSTSSLRAYARQTLAVTRMAFRRTVLGREFPLVVLGLVTLALVMVTEQLKDPISGSPVWPLTETVASTLAQASGLIALLAIFYAGELVWRERDAGMHELADAQPVPDWVPLVGSFLALALLCALLLAVLMATGMLVQAAQGFYAFQPGLYLAMLFGLSLPTLLLFAVLALLVHVLVNQKYIGHLAAVLLVVLMPRLGLQHNLLVYGSGPDAVYSDLAGFGGAVAPFLWFKAYWGGWALLLGLLALLFVVRGRDDTLRSRLRRARQRCTRRFLAAAAGATLLVLSTAGFIFYNTNVLHRYRSAWQGDEVYAEYERRYRRFEHVAQPWLTGMRLEAEIYPERRAVTVRASYRLVNRTSQPIDSIHLSSFPGQDITLRGVGFDRPAAPVLEDPGHGYRVYALRRPLQPRDSLLLHFQVDVARRGFRNREQPSTNVLVGSFTHLSSMHLLPTVGYQRELMELSDAGDRRAHGLPPAGVRPRIDDARALRQPLVSPDADWIDFEGTVATAADQVAVLPGTLERSWTAGSRRYFHYRARTPIPKSFALLSGRWAVDSARWRDVDIRILHHPEHAFNVQRTVADVKASLDCFTAEFGPYPHRQLWLLEFPRYGTFARAYPGQLVYTENHPIAIARPRAPHETRTDVPLLVTAHELAHQWWGKQVLGADVEGAQVLSETLAQYSALLVLERTRGVEAAHRLLYAMHVAYLDGRSTHVTPEVPLLLTTDHDFIHYRKGLVVMNALRDYIGEERVNAALRSLLRRHALQGPPYATSLDLYRELQAVTPDSLHALLADLFATITLWDLRATGARAEPVGDGRYRVTVTVDATRLRSDSLGKDTPVAMNDPVDIGVFGAAASASQLGPVLYLQKQRIGSGRQTITVTVAGKPARAGIDPYNLLPARRLDALIKLDTHVPEVATSAPPGTMRR